MRYTKPEICKLGQASTVILGSKNVAPPEPGNMTAKAPKPDADIDD